MSNYDNNYGNSVFVRTYSVKMVRWYLFQVDSETINRSEYWFADDESLRHVSGQKSTHFKLVMCQLMLLQVLIKSNSSIKEEILQISSKFHSSFAFLMFSTEILAWRDVIPLQIQTNVLQLPEHQLEPSKSSWTYDGTIHRIVKPAVH